MREFADLQSFAEHLAIVSVAIVEFEQKGLEKAAQLIESDAKAQIGQYQEAVGPFQDWAELADSTESEKSRLGYSIDAPLLREGDLRDSIKHEVERGEAIIGSELDIAAYQEFGTNTIPPRPFIGPAAYRNKEKIEKILGAAIVEGLTGGEKVHESLGYNIEI